MMLTPLRSYHCRRDIAVTAAYATADASQMPHAPLRHADADMVAD